MIHLIIIILCFQSTIFCIEYAPIIQTDRGNVRGFITKLTDNSSIFVYQGIRYGQAKRFEKSTFLQNHWNDTYDAIEFRSVCPQQGNYTIITGLDNSPENSQPTMSEDCLYLSIYRPEKISNNKRIPVMVWIHGGAFIVGSIFDDIYNPSYMVSMGKVIVVTINYRLGAFGFLYAGTDDSPGNQGLHDQILALKWVQNNIGHFGGDPNMVTVFGESAGALSVSALILSPLANGLFHRAIIQSGAILSYYGSWNKNLAMQKTLDFAHRLHCYQPNILDCLRNRTINQILNVYNDEMTFSRLMIPIFGDDLLPISPNEALKVANNQVDLMFGVTKNEAAGFIVQYIPEVEANDISLSMTKMAIRLLVMAFQESKQTAEKVVEFYSKNLNKSTNQNDLRLTIADILGDYQNVCPTILFGEYYARAMKPFTKHFYSYRLMLPLSNGPWSCQKWQGVCHVQDVIYLFYVPLNHHLYTKQEIKLSNDMIKAWTLFAKNGNPGSLTTISKPNQPIEWKMAMTNSNYTNDDYVSFMSLDPNNYQMIENYFEEKCDKFWKPYIFK
ncbi:cholinesterase-like [Dermatophagoides pteronyssinus]|uniref:Carboxylic ester hydrolase n=1 Tax=Dermatophagoides pteronyssinus TaxID=6956 RepID=A0A6P6Y7M9_DERPT|nr:carboxylesterase 5A-like [Dermatophagoides pteronyssinus]